MNDLIERLRTFHDHKDLAEMAETNVNLRFAAAAEIERLRSALECIAASDQEKSEAGTYHSDHNQGFSDGYNTAYEEVAEHARSVLAMTRKLDVDRAAKHMARFDRMEVGL